MIERDPAIKFHEQGTLNAVTRWVSTHDEGLAEWLKNARRAYQPDRGDVKEEHREAVLLLKDGDGSAARIGLLDVGGATLEDVTAWGTWQDPEASRRGGPAEEEETQGNGGKAYMYRLFAGPARILGVRNRKRNCKGFEGPNGLVERGTPGFIPNVAAGRDVPITSISSELENALFPYGVDLQDLPGDVQAAIAERQAFTLVEGESPTDIYKNRIDAEDLISRLIRHEQSTLAIEQFRLYAIHNGQPLNGGKPLVLPPIDPYPGLEGPFVYEIPEEIPLSNGLRIATTEGGKRPAGRLVLHTSRENMPNAHKKLKPRWRISYRTQFQMIGSKPVSDLTPATPGAYFIYGTVELPALEPGYVEHGRRRPKDGPLVEAVDLFIADRVREVAREISERRKRDLDDKALNEVQQENQKLDRFKNRFLPSDGQGGGGPGEDGPGPRRREETRPVDYGTEPDSIELLVPEGDLKVGKGVHLRLNPLLRVRVVDAVGRPVALSVKWLSSEPTVARFREDSLEARNKGRALLWAEVRGSHGKVIRSTDVPVDVWNVDHVLLTPRSLEILLGQRQQVVAEATDDEGRRSTQVFLDWRHTADDQLMVRIGPSGWVTGNRIGRTAVTAGAGDPSTGGVWARIPVQIAVLPNPDAPERGTGFPRLLLTGRDLDPATGHVREGDPDSPVLWQEASDFVNNVWWLNLQSAEAAFAFGQRVIDPTIWRTFHSQVVMEMVAQVHMQAEFTRSSNEQPDYWANHHTAVDRHRVRIVQQMWPELERYVAEGEGLE